AISAYSLKVQFTPWPRYENILKIVIAGGILVIFLAAQTRTGLLGLPAFVTIGVVLFVGVSKPLRLISLIIVSAAVLIASVASSDTMRARIAEGIHQVKGCQGADSTQATSLCIRLQLWRTAIDAGLENPWVGLGDAGEFNHYLRDVALPSGWTTD